MRACAIILATALVLTPLEARAVDLVIWWEKGFYPGEDEAIREIVAAFENKTGKHTELTFVPYTDLTGKVLASLKAEHPPDFLYGSPISDYFNQ